MSYPTIDLGKRKVRNPTLITELMSQMRNSQCQEIVIENKSDDEENSG